MGGSLGTSTFYTKNTDFDVSQAVISGTAEYNATINDIDAIAYQLKRLQTADIPVLWRPLYEAEGGWFWWGAKGPAPALTLWDIIYDRLTNYHGLNNLIWVWNSIDTTWYPGNDKLDILSYDSYPGDYNYATQKNVFDQMFDLCSGEKILALAENGPIPDINECFKQDARWAYFCSWNDLVASQNTDQHIQEVYANNYVINLFDKNCNGDCNSTAFIDSCGKCAGGNTGITPVCDTLQCVTEITDKITDISIKIIYNQFDRNIDILSGNQGVYAIHDIQGRKVSGGSIREGENRINISLVKGIYLITVTTSSIRKYQKISIQ